MSGWKVQGSWAAEVEAEEAQNGGALPVEDFPSLGEAAKNPQPKSKKKATKMALGDFLGATPSRAGVSDKELIGQLPTGSRGKSADAPSGGLGGGFRDYGGRGDREYGDGERERRPRQEDMGPSRADEADDWGKDRKFVSSSSFGGGYGSESRGGGGGFGGFDRSRDRGDARDMGPSRADEADSWGNRGFQASRGFGDRDRGGFGDRDRGFGGRDRGFGDRDRGFGDRDRGFGDRDRARDRPEVDGDWGRGRGGANGYGFDSGNRDRGFSDGSSRVDAADKWTKPSSESSSQGYAERPADERPSERPRLNLKPRTLPIPEGGAAPPPTDTTPGSGQPRKSNPFGNARPREEVLKEKGVDYKKEELKLEHDATLRPDSEEEEALKKEIELLKTKLEALSANDSTDPDELQELKSDIETKETNLLKLAAELDDQVKYAKDAPRVDRSHERGRDRDYGDSERRGFGSRSRDRFEGSRERSSHGW